MSCIRYYRLLLRQIIWSIARLYDNFTNTFFFNSLYASFVEFVKTGRDIACAILQDFLAVRVCEYPHTVHSLWNSTWHSRPASKFYVSAATARQNSSSYYRLRRIFRGRNLLTRRPTFPIDFGVGLRLYGNIQ